MSAPAVAASMFTTLDEPLRSAVEAAQSRVWLSSPFITGDACLWLESAAKRARAPWRLLTALDPVAAAYGSLHLPGLRRLLDVGVEIRNLSKLHAKVFLTDSAGFVGSANLTGAGLGTARRPNAELSVALDFEQRAAAETVFARWWADASEVRTDDIDECEQDAMRVPVRVPRLPGNSQEMRAKSERADELLRQSMDADVWVKALYRGPEAYPWRYEFIGSPDKGKPAFRIGDLLLVYAVYVRSCFVILRVAGNTVRDARRQAAAGTPAADATRWPWVTDIELELQVPPSAGVALDRLGLTGQSLRNGHCRMPVGGLAAALESMLV